MSMVVARDIQGKVYTPTFLQPIENELQQVEDFLSSELLSNVGTITTVSSHIIKAGGKRLRPSLVILATRACGESDHERLINIATCTEIAHMATLVHDDVIDEADSRRGQVTANARWGNQISVLSGDYMLAKVFSILASDGDPKIMRALAQATVAMTEGEIRQIEAHGDTGAQIVQYLSIIRDKTAMFMSSCCRLGAILGGGDERSEDALAKYGLELGMAFQITDDLLDLIGDSKETGKPIGGDIREGKITMPLIFALEKANLAEREAIEKIVAKGTIDSDDLEFVRGLVEKTGAVEETRDAAARFVLQSVEALDILPNTEGKEALVELAKHTLWRRS